MDRETFVLPALFFVATMFWHAKIYSHEQPTGSECPVTLTSGGIYGKGGLQATLPLKGRFVFKPGGPGFVDSDGALGIKFGWERRVKGTLSVGGHRLDGPSAPARAYLTDYGDFGFQPSYLVFPTPGCWRITGRVADETLTFVLLVEKIGEGPAWRFEGLSNGWRVTSDAVPRTSAEGLCEAG